MERTKVLVVDDYPDILDLIRFVLEEEGMAVLESQNATKGLAIAKSELPDIVILDLRMPDMDGFDFINKIRSCKKTEGIPILIISAKTQDDAIIKALKTGANSFLAKPFNIDVLVGSVKALINKP